MSKLGIELGDYVCDFEKVPPDPFCPIAKRDKQVRIRVRVRVRVRVRATPCSRWHAPETGGSPP